MTASLARTARLRTVPGRAGKPESLRRDSGRPGDHQSQSRQPSQPCLRVWYSGQPWHMTLATWTVWLCQLININVRVDRDRTQKSCSKRFSQNFKLYACFPRRFPKFVPQCPQARSTSSRWNKENFSNNAATAKVLRFTSSYDLERTNIWNLGTP